MSIDLDPIWKALADETRRTILDFLRTGPKPTTAIVEQFPDLSRFAVMKHLDVLDDAGLIDRSKAGRTVTVRLRPGPMKEAMDWLKRYERFWTKSLDRLADYAERKEAEARKAAR